MCPVILVFSYAQISLFQVYSSTWMRISPLNCMRMTNLKNLLVQSKLGGSAKKKKGYSPHISLDYNHNTTTTSVLISIFEEKNIGFHLWFLYIYIFHRGQDGEHSHKKSPRKSADPGVIYNIPEKYSAITGIWLYKFSLQLTSYKSNGDAMLYIKSQNLMSVVLVLEWAWEVCRKRALC